MSKSHSCIEINIEFIKIVTQEQNNVKNFKNNLFLPPFRRSVRVPFGPSVYFKLFCIEPSRKKMFCLTSVSTENDQYISPTSLSFRVALDTRLETHKANTVY